MKAAVLVSSSQPFLEIQEIPQPEAGPGYVLLRVLACGVCRTDLHIAEGDLPPVQPRLIPGHQIVGDVVDGATAELPLGSRAGVSWIGGVDGSCWFCRHDMENLCDQPTFTGYTVHGGYAEYAVVRADFAFPLPAEVDPCGENGEFHSFAWAGPMSGTTAGGVSTRSDWTDGAATTTAPGVDEAGVPAQAASSTAPRLPPPMARKDLLDRLSVTSFSFQSAEPVRGRLEAGRVPGGSAAGMSRLDYLVRAGGPARTRQGSACG